MILADADIYTDLVPHEASAAAVTVVLRPLVTLATAVVGNVAVVASTSTTTNAKKCKMAAAHMSVMALTAAAMGPSVVLVTTLKAGILEAAALMVIL